MKRLLLISGFLFGMLSCTNRKSVPGDVIKPDSMQVIFRDAIEVDQYSLSFLLKDSSKRNTKLETRGWYEEVFRIHHVTRDDFERSLAFYQSRPDLMKELLDSMSAHASRDKMASYHRMSDVNGKPDTGRRKMTHADSMVSNYGQHAMPYINHQPLSKADSFKLKTHRLNHLDSLRLHFLPVHYTKADSLRLHIARYTHVDSLRLHLLPSKRVLLRPGRLPNQ